MSVRIDLVSDTATRPTDAMRQAMASAEVGDEQLGEDPTVNALCARVSALLGQPAALFLPSGTMCNQIAIAVHCRPGDEIIAADSSHIIGSEGAGAAVFAGCFVRPIITDDGRFGAGNVEAALRPRTIKAPSSRLLCLEQTANRGGGSVWPEAQVSAVIECARQAGLKVHMDGARLMNAVVASGTPAAAYTAKLDSVWLDLSKGLGCPVGGVLAGSQEFIASANVWKHRFGGAMRQAGIIAAAGIYALDHHVERLQQDHDNAKAFAAAIAAIPGITVVQEQIETNLVFFDVTATGHSAPELAAALLERGIRIGVEGPYHMRAVTHLDVDAAMVAEAAAALATLAAT